MTVGVTKIGLQQNKIVYNNHMASVDVLKARLLEPISREQKALMQVLPAIGLVTSCITREIYPAIFFDSFLKGVTALPEARSPNREKAAQRVKA